MKLTITPFLLVATIASTAATRTTSATTTTIRGSSSGSRNNGNDNENIDAPSENTHRELAWDLGDWVGDASDGLTDGFGNDGESSSLSPSDNNEGGWDEWFFALLNSNTANGLVDGVLDDDGLALDGVFDDGFFDLNFLLGDDLSVCSLVEFGIGMTPTFGIEANCDCSKGGGNNNGKGLKVGCSFEQCAADGDNNDNSDNLAAAACGTVDLDFEFGATGGVVNAGACIDFADDQYEETCFSYGIDVRSGTPTMMAVATDTMDTETTITTCKASYGGNSCECSMDGIFCLSIDCSAHLPGGKMNTCQTMSMVGLDDIPNWFPNFDAFAPGFVLAGNDNDSSNNDSSDSNNSDQDALQDQNPEQDAADSEETLPVNINPIVQSVAPGEEDLPVNINLVLPDDPSVIVKSELGAYTTSSSNNTRGSCGVAGLLGWAAVATLIVGLY